MEKFKKEIAGLLIIVLLFLLGIYINQFTFSDFSSQPQQANRIKKSPQNITAVIPNAALTANTPSAVRKLKKTTAPGIFRPLPKANEILLKF